MSEDQERRVGRREFICQGLTLTAILGTSQTGGQAKAGLAAPSVQDEARTFLKEYVQGWLPLETASQEAAWAAVTDVNEAHTAAQVTAMQKVNEFVGAPPVIESVTRLLAHKNELDDLTVRQLEKARLRAAEAPGSLPDVVKARTEAEAKQSAAQDGFTYTRKHVGRPDENPSANDIDRVLVASKDLDERLSYWEVSKTIGVPLRDGLLRLRNLRNKVAKALGFDNFFALQVADYGMTVPEMISLCDQLVAEVQPLYAELHTWAKYALAKRYNADVPPEMIPAHWLPNRWGQNWPTLVERGGYGRPLQREDQGIYHRAGRALLSLAWVP
jgi:peptidyl-dipeptidase A